ncbi:RHS repeat-associated core domain-containing protein [Dactylosporangium sp. McL0621]|uniref:RHS repeat-associated core domain-containing protein n=1 Tax=Dactylosporangium sp. McL0621 TaxID=3415678 RepID=UPI003CF153A7
MRPRHPSTDIRPCPIQIVDHAHTSAAIRAASSLSTQELGYDNAGRLTSVQDIGSGSCTTRVYGFNAGYDRISLAAYDPGTGGVCQSTIAATTATWSYDTADRVTNAGYTYDVLGRTANVPAADGGGSGAITAAYHVNDLVRSITQGSRTTTYTLDTELDRIRSYSDTDGSVVTNHVHHYSGDGDSPVWTDESAGTWTRPVAGLGSLAAMTTTNGTTALAWQLVDLHGDVVATINDGDVGLSSAGGYTEYGVARNAADRGARRYGWLGANQRAADAPGGLVLMGVRLYNPNTGRFLQVDPVAGGGCNAYEYACADPVNKFDLDGRIPLWLIQLGLDGMSQILTGPVAAAACSPLMQPICGALIGAASGALSFYIIYRLTKGKNPPWGQVATHALTAGFLGALGCLGREVREAWAILIGRFFRRMVDFLAPRLARLGWSFAVTVISMIGGLMANHGPKKSNSSPRRAAKMPPGIRGHSRDRD